MRKLCPFTCLCLALSALLFSCAALPKVKESPHTDSAILTAPATDSENLESASPESTSLETPVIEQPVSESFLSENSLQAKETKFEAPKTISLSTAQEKQAIEEGFQNPYLPFSPLILEGLRLMGIPERPSKPAVPEYIMGKGIIPGKNMAAYLLNINPEIEKEFVENLALFYIEEAAIEGVNHDTAFAQMCLETGFLKFGNLVTPDQNNFCGLGATGPGQPGEKFQDPRTGVRAHIQHLKAYATDVPLKQDLVDPRYFLVRLGSSPAIKGLAGTWAADRSYAEKINNILEKLYIFAFEG
jgi:hypothetical protein